VRSDCCPGPWSSWIKVGVHSRSTVATITGIDPYLALLYSRLPAVARAVAAAPAMVWAATVEPTLI